MEKRSVTVVGPDPDGLYWVTLEAGENRVSVPVQSGVGIVGQVMKAFTNLPALTNQKPAEHLHEAATRIHSILDEVSQPEDERIGAWHAVADALDSACPGWIAGDQPAQQLAVETIRKLANQAAMANLGVAAIANEMKAAGWRPPQDGVLMQSPIWARVLLKDKNGAFYWASAFAGGARFESVSGRVGGMLDLVEHHNWQVVASVEPITQH